MEKFKALIIKLWPFAIFTFALGLRFIFLSRFQYNPFFDTGVKGVDPSLYHEWAKELAQGYWPGYKLLYGHPFYPYLVSLFYRFWAVDSYSFIVIQFLMGSLSCVLIYLIAKKIFSRPAAAISSIFAVVYGPFLFYEGLLVPNALAIFLNLGAFLMLLNILDFPNARRTFLAGLLSGCSLITNSGIAPFIILAVFWLVVTLRKEKKALFTHAACFIIAVALPLAFMSLKHFNSEGKFDFFGAHGGINFYVGNNPESNGTFRAPLGFTPSAEGLSEDSARYAAKASGSTGLSAAGVSGFWYNKALSYIKSNPGRWLKLLFRKFILFWNNAELGDVADYYFAKNDSLVLKYNIFNFAFIAALGFVGMALALRNFRKMFLLYAGVFSFMFSCALFFVNSRYRLSVVPYLMIFAGFAVWSAYKSLRVRDFKRLAVSAALFLSFFIFSNIKALPLDTCTPMYNLAVIYEKRGFYDLAIEVSEKLLKDNQGLPMVHFNLGVCYYQKKMPDKAIAEFEEAVRLNPMDKDSCFNLGMIYYEKGDFNKALKEFNRSLRGSEKDLAPLYWIGKTYQKSSEFKKAAQSYEEALKINPEVLQITRALEEVKGLQKRKK